MLEISQYHRTISLSRLRRYDSCFKYNVVSSIEWSIWLMIYVTFVFVWFNNFFKSILCNVKARYCVLYIIFMGSTWNKVFERDSFLSLKSSDWSSLCELMSFTAADPVALFRNDCRFLQTRGRKRVLWRLLVSLDSYFLETFVKKLLY